MFLRWNHKTFVSFIHKAFLNPKLSKKWYVIKILEKLANTRDSLNPHGASKSIVDVTKHVNFHLCRLYPDSVI